MPRKLASFFLKSRFRKHLHSITTVLVAALVLSFFLPLSVGLVYSLRVERARLDAILARFHGQLLDSLELGMENALRNFEPNEAQNAAKIAINDFRVMRIKVYSSVYEMTLAELARVPARPGAVSRVRRRTLVRGGEELGYVEVAVDGAFYEATLASERADIIVLFVSMLACGLLLIIPAIYLKVLRPMARLMRQAENLSAGNLETALEWKGVDELSRLGNMLETMRRRLSANFLRIQELASHDELTGMPNRRAFFKEGGKALEYCRRFNQPLTLALMDPDHFKQINDTHGHAAGDSILREFAELIRNAIRKTDFCARIGGEEFVLCLPGTALAEAKIVAEKLRTRLMSHHFSYDQTVTASIGLAQDMRDGSLDALLQDADRAMYRAKGLGRNRVVLFTPRPGLEKTQ